MVVSPNAGMLAGMSESAEPHHHHELMSALQAAHRESLELFESLAEPVLFHRPADGVWSAAEHVVHLVKSVQAVAMALKIPKVLLAARFGTAREESRTYAQVREDYLSRLAAGGVASGPYVPSSLNPGDEQEAAAMRGRALSGWRRAGEGLEKQVAKWSEKALDRYRLPHPLLGKLTVREMLCFTHYHDLHHLGIVRRLRES